MPESTSPTPTLVSIIGWMSIVIGALAFAVGVAFSYQSSSEGQSGLMLMKGGFSSIGLGLILISLALIARAVLNIEAALPRKVAMPTNHIEDKRAA